MPVIVDDGFALSESSVIVEYLEEQYRGSGAPLWPIEPRARAIARRTAIEGDAHIYPYVRKLVLELLMRKAGEPDAAAIADAKGTLKRELAQLAQNLEGPYIAGLEPSAADFALYPFLAVLNRVADRRPEQAIGEVMPGSLRPWMSRIEALPYFAKTIPPHWKAS